MKSLMSETGMLPSVKIVFLFAWNLVPYLCLKWFSDIGCEQMSFLELTCFSPEPISNKTVYGMLLPMSLTTDRENLVD